MTGREILGGVSPSTHHTLLLTINADLDAVHLWSAD